MAAAGFTPETLRFLRGLARHNDRDWFEARRATYERAIREPMVALVDEINSVMAEFAPEHLRPAHKIAMRIYRDTRFSPDKRPYKTHLGAWWPRAGQGKDATAGFYLDIAPEKTYVAAGLYEPERDAMLAARRWMAEHHERYRPVLEAVLQGTGTDGTMQPLDPKPLTRNPAGFAPDHPASDLLRARNWGVQRVLEVGSPLQAGFAGEAARWFRQAAPLVALLNEPLAAGAERAR